MPHKLLCLILFAEIQCAESGTAILTTLDPLSTEGHLDEVLEIILVFSVRITNSDE